MAAKTKFAITTTQLEWIVQALHHDIAGYMDDVERTDSELVRSLGNIAIENRESLVTSIMDMLKMNVKRIEVI